MAKQRIGIRQEVHNDSDIAIHVANLHKSFKLPTDKAFGLKQTIINCLRGVKGYKKQSVLKGLDLDIKKGEFIGIVGRNGSGKSTFLKTLAGIYYPEKGKITINGNLIPFIELGVGFNPELTGRENVYLNGALLGFSNKEVDAMYDEIWEFAELEEFQDQKLKNYSSGMQVRLAFSIAIRAKGDILLLDEVLAVGDEAFQNKCNQFFSKIKQDKSKTIILVTHSMASVRQYCNRAILIRDGKIIIDGSPEDVANKYSLENAERVSSVDSPQEKTSDLIKNFEVKLKSSKQTTSKQPIEVAISYDYAGDGDTYLGLTLWDINRRQALINSNSRQHACNGPGHKKIIFKTSLQEINDSNIRVNISVRDKNGTILAYYPDKKSPTIALRRDDYPDPQNKTTEATLFNRGKFEVYEDK